MNENQSFWPAGMKKTRQRMCVCSALEGAELPLSAAELYQRVSRSGTEISLSTVYRILEYLVKEGAAVRTALPESDTAVYALNRRQHTHYAICLGCHKIIELENCPMEHYVPQLSESEFHVLGHRLELYGYCKDCAADRRFPSPAQKPGG